MSKQPVAKEKQHDTDSVEDAKHVSKVYRKSGGGTANIDSVWMQEELYRVHRTVLPRRLSRLRVPREWREDIVQRAMLEAWGRCPREWWQEEDERLRRWLLVVARRLAISRLRRLQRHPVQSLGAEQGNVSDRRGEEAAISARRREECALLRAWTEELREKDPDSYRLLHGRYSEDRSVEELAEELGISRNAASQRLARLRARFRAEFLRRRENMDEP